MNNYALNRKNLKFVSSLFELLNIEYTAFYGTLLGIHRDGDLILHDDDIDFLVNIKYDPLITSLFKNPDIIPNGRYHGDETTFFQYRPEDDSYVDFYFYHSTPHNYVIDKWNFLAMPNNPNTDLFIPKTFLETQSVDMNGFKTRIPQDPEAACKFLYGERFRETLVKWKDYESGILNNIPHHKYFI